MVPHGIFVLPLNKWRPGLSCLSWVCVVFMQAGDHVRVLSGPQAGERGMVVALHDGMCILLPDSRQGELRVFAKDLTEAAESGTGECVRSAT